MVGERGDNSSAEEGDKALSESLAGVRYYEHVDGMPLTKADPGHQEKAKCVTRKPQGLWPLGKAQLSNPEKLL